MYEIDRPTGMLTRKDRRYLYHDDLPETRQGRYERKKGCRERVVNGLLDFQFIRWLPPDERRKVFGDMDPGDSLHKSLVAGVAVMKLACDASGIPLEELLEDGIELGETEPRGDLVDPEPAGWVKTGSGKTLESVEVDITEQYRDAYFPEVIKKRLIDGDQLEDDELAALVRSDSFDEETIAELKRHNESQDKR